MKIYGHILYVSIYIYIFIKNYFFKKKGKKRRQVYALFKIKTEQ